MKLIQLSFLLYRSALPTFLLGQELKAQVGGTLIDGFGSHPIRNSVISIEGKYAAIIAVKGDVMPYISLLQDVDLMIKHGKTYKD